MSLKGKVLLVTGASQGIGLAIAQRAIAEGAHVAGVARRITPELEKSGALPISADLATREGPDNATNAAISEYGGIDVLVNNVGAFDARVHGILSVTEEQWQHTFEVNFFSAVRAVRAALPSLLQRQGSIINVSSIRARFPQPGTVDYGAAKAALTNFSKALAEELGPQGVRVNTVSPGPTRTPAWEGDDGIGATLAAARDTTVADFLDVFPRQAGLNTGRLTEPDEVAELTLLLASGAVRNINGADHVIDGGQSKTA